MDCVRIGTRKSTLAQAQTQLIADALRQANPSLEVQLIAMSTSGDRYKGTLADAGGKGLFVRELERALRDGEIDLAVHSAKDVPTQLPEDIPLIAIAPRADARDAIVSTSGDSVQQLPQAATAGTCSLRRKAQLLAMRPDLTVKPLRGNVDTRIRKILGDKSDSDLDATVLAMAGLQRGGFLTKYSSHVYPMPVHKFIPAAGQGALAIQALANRDDVAKRVRSVNHPISQQAVFAERSVLAALEADCHSCIAVHIYKDGSLWRGLAMAAHRDGSDAIHCSVDAPDPAQVARNTVDRLKQEGVNLLMLS